MAGDRSDVVMEDELDPAVRHRNTYETSKFEAEEVLREAAGELPITVYRPTIITPAGEGDARSPVDWPIRIYASGLWRTCPGRPETPVDLVTAGFVCDSIAVLRQNPASIGRTFHLSAGVDGAITLGEIAALLQRLLPKAKPLRFVDPKPWRRYVHPVLKWVPGSTGRIVNKGELYLPYFLNNPRFDNSNTRALLTGSGVEIIRSSVVLEQLFSGALHRRQAIATRT